jgi:hypothetical protein
METIRKKIESKRGKPISIHRGYIYNLDRIGLKNNYRWRCKIRNCRGLLLTNEKDEIINMINHDHNACVDACNAVILRYEIKKKAEKTNSSFTEILTSTVKNCEDATIIKHPKVNSIRDNVNKIRNKNNNFIPKKFDDFPDVLRVTLTGKQFLLHDSGITKSNRLVIFSSENSLIALKKASIWQADGTFNVCPVQFYQLYVIYGYMFGETIPLVYALMTLKTTEIYYELFSILKEHGFKPNGLIIDFESAVSVAFI